MKPQDHETFWDRYDREVRPAVERACRGASRLYTDGTMDPSDMAAWVHTRVWKMLENSTYPAFHDDPGTGEAIERLQGHAGVLARWSYLALSRRHWKRLERESSGDLSRVEHLSVSQRAEAPLERREAVDEAIAKVRTTLSDSVRQKLAASMQDKSARRRTAVALGVTRREDERLISRVDSGMIKENTVQQMRSRARKHAAEALGTSIRLPVILAVAALTIAFASPRSFAGEQSGGRKGTGMFAPSGLMEATQAASSSLPMARGEQSGGRGPKGG